MAQTPMPPTPVQHRLLSVVFALALVLLIAPAARAASCQAPPGISAVAEYCEVVPGGGHARHGASPGASPAVPGATAEALRQDGANGQAVLNLTNVSPRPHAPAGKAKRSSAARPSGTPLSGIRNSVASGATAGSVFVWVLVAIALGVIGVAWLRYRGRGPAD
jgi:hypothetical protein